MTTIGVILESASATMPTKANPSDACYDIYCDLNNPGDTITKTFLHIESSPSFDPDSQTLKFETPVISQDIHKKTITTGSLLLPPMSHTIVPTNIRLDIPEGYYVAIHSRSGMGFKHHVQLSNSTGIIDSGYQGLINVSLANLSGKYYRIKHGDRIAQMELRQVLPTQLTQINQYDQVSQRGIGGFGSSGT